MYIALLTTLMLTLSGCDRAVEAPDYVGSHDRFRQAHVVFVGEYRQRIDGVLESLEAALAGEETVEYLLAQWALLEQLFAEFHVGNNVYIQGYMSDDELARYKNAMNVTNSELYSHVLANQADVRGLIARGDRAGVSAALTQLQQRFHDTIDKIEADAQGYQGALR